MRVVLDTNILARATPGKSGPAAALRLALRDPHLLILSRYLLNELGRVLRYERVRAIHGLSDAELDEFLISLQSNALTVSLEGATAGNVVRDDPGDDPIVATAVAGAVQYLCTLDKHFYRPEVVAYCQSHRIEVVNDVELLRMLQP